MSDFVSMSKNKEVTDGIGQSNLMPSCISKNTDVHVFRSDGFNIIVKKAKKLKKDKDNDHYRMISNPRGCCIIIDNQKFQKMDFRKGSKADADRLSEVYTQLSFEVRRYTNLTSKEMDAIFDEFSKESCIKSQDCLNVIILSHGVCDGIYGTDDNVLQFKAIINKFNNKNCIHLRNKPKIFNFVCCRNGKAEGSYLLDLELDSNQQEDGEKIPLWSDIFVYYSAIGGNVSHRNPITGSFFGYELAHCLKDFSHEEHLHDIMTTKLSKRIEQREPNIQLNPNMPAIETRTYGSVKKVYFNPGLFKQKNIL